MHILLVGDDVLTPEGLQRYLEEALLQAEIVPCLTGPAAVKIAAEIPRGIVIAHMKLPGSDYGSKVLQQVKEVNSKIHTVLVIRAGLYGDLEKTVQNLIDDVVTIPVHKNNFRRSLRSLFRTLEDREDDLKRKEVYQQINQSLVSSSEKNQAVPIIIPGRGSSKK